MRTINCLRNLTTGLSYGEQPSFKNFGKKSARELIEFINFHVGLKQSNITSPRFDAFEKAFKKLSEEYRKIRKS